MASVEAMARGKTLICDLEALNWLTYNPTNSAEEKNWVVKESLTLHRRGKDRIDQSCTEESDEKE
eukprot:c17735_g3_i1 orf=109-303(-)